MIAVGDIAVAVTVGVVVSFGVAEVSLCEPVPIEFTAETR